MENKYLLTYTHEELQALLDKVATGNVLPVEDYKMLIDTIGIENISTFSGNYEDLKNKPDIPQFVSDLINDADYVTLDSMNVKIQAVQNALLDLMADGEGVNSLKYATKVEVENIVEALRLYTDDEIAQAIVGLNLTGLASKAEVNKKADKVHIHKISDVTDLTMELEKRSKVDHNHDNVYALKVMQHYHMDPEALDRITSDKLDAWDEHVNDVNAELLLKADINHRHDLDYADKSKEHVHTELNKAALDTIFKEDIDRWDTCLNFNTRGKQTSANVGGIQEGMDLDGLDLHDIIRKILYPDKKYEITGSLKLNKNGSIFEVGTSVIVEKIILNVVEKGSNPMQQINFYRNNAVVHSMQPTDSTLASYSFDVNDTLTSSVSNSYYRVELKDATGIIVKANTTAVNFYLPYYHGVVSPDFVPNEASIKAMTKSVAAKAQQSYSFTMREQCACFAYPASYGNLSSILDPNGFEQINGFTKKTVTLVDASNKQQQYNVYIGPENTNTNFKLTFKF